MGQVLRTSGRSSADESQLLLDLSRTVTSTLDLQDVLDRSFAALRHLIEFGGGAIQLIEDGFLVAAATDPPATPEARSVRIPVGQGISGRIAATGEPIYIPDIWADARVHPDGKRTSVSSGVRSYFGMPIILHGDPTGVLQIDDPRLDAFTPEARALVLAFTPTIAAAVQNARLYEMERETHRRLQETDRMKRDFLAVASHELRTPLTTIAGFGYTLARHAGELDSDTISDVGMRIWRAGRRLERVMSDLLDLSKIERGMLSVELRPLDVEPILVECAREQDDGTHELVLDIEPRLPVVRADPDRLHQIVGNLLGNSRKFSARGTAITMRAAHTPQGVSVSVADDGVGIPAAALRRVFEPFFQAETGAARAAEGLGIGLFIVRQLCDRMGARIDVDSVVGRGTTITVHLPLA